MPDISMCVNYECPKRADCYRYRATPSMRQSYARFGETITKEDGGTEFKCDDFVQVIGTQLFTALESRDERNRSLTETA